jgi:dihydroorotase
MSRTSRRVFLGKMGAAAVVLPGLSAVKVLAGPEGSPGAPVAAQAPASYDLLISGGRVVDPSQKLSTNLDVAISNGKIARVAANIPQSQAREVFDARGKLVTPGLINMHAHVYRYAIPISTDPDHVGIPVGVTTIVDAGSGGANTFLGFRKYVIDPSVVRIYAQLNIAAAGLLGNELYLDPKWIDPKAAIRVVEANRDRIVGIKVRINGDHNELAHDLDVLQKAREAADAVNLPIMMHWTNEPDLLAILKKGDILTHPFNPPTPTTSNLFGGDGPKVLPQILALKDRGIWTDGQAVTSHHQWEISERAASQGWFPDVITTDLGAKTPESPYGLLLPSIMTQYLYLGLSVDQVIERVTIAPTKIFKFQEKLGTLEPGVIADVTVMDLAEGNFELLDGKGQKRMGHQKFVPVATVHSGTLVKADGV